MSFVPCSVWRQTTRYAPGGSEISARVPFRAATSRPSAAETIFTVYGSRATQSAGSKRSVPAEATLTVTDSDSSLSARDCAFVRASASPAAESAGK